MEPVEVWNTWLWQSETPCSVEPAGDRLKCVCASVCVCVCVCVCVKEQGSRVQMVLDS